MPLLRAMPRTTVPSHHGSLSLKRGPNESGFLLGSRAQLKNPSFRLPSGQCWAVDESLGQGPCTNGTGNEGETRTPWSHWPGRRPLTPRSGVWRHPASLSVMPEEIPR